MAEQNNIENILYGQLREDNQSLQEFSAINNLGIKQVFVQNNKKIKPEFLKKVTQPITLKRQETKQIQIKPTNIDGLLMVEPDISDLKTSIFFIKLKDFQRVVNKENVYQELYNLPNYRYLSKYGLEIMAELSPENINDDPEYCFLSDQKLGQLNKQQAFDSQLFIHYQIDNSSVWPLNSQHPLSPIVRLELGSKNYRLNSLEEYLNSNNNIKNIYRAKTLLSSQEYYGKQEMLIEYKLPQAVFEIYNQLALEEEREDPTNQQVLEFLDTRFAMASTFLINQKVLDARLGDPLGIQKFRKPLQQAKNKS